MNYNDTKKRLSLCSLSLQDQKKGLERLKAKLKRNYQDSKPTSKLIIRNIHLKIEMIEENINIAKEDIEFIRPETLAQINDSLSNLQRTISKINILLSSSKLDFDNNYFEKRAFNV